MERQFRSIFAPTKSGKTLLGRYNIIIPAEVEPAAVILEFTILMERSLDSNQRSSFASNCPDMQWNTSGIHDMEGGGIGCASLFHSSRLRGLIPWVFSLRGDRQTNHVL